MTKTLLFRSFIALVFVNAVITMFVHQRWIRGVSNAVNAAPQATVESQPHWSLGLRFLFRFFCCYWLLSALPTPNRVSVFDPIPGARTAFAPYRAIWRAMSPWVAVHLFHVTGRAAMFPSHSADSAI